MESEAEDLAKLGAQFADPARAAMVISLMDGSSRSAGELGLAANVSASSASGHLSKLVSSGILTDSRLGRQKHYRIAAAATFGVPTRDLAPILALNPLGTHNRGFPEPSPRGKWLSWRIIQLMPNRSRT